MIASAAAALGKAIGGYGKKPVVPGFIPVDASAVQGETISGNIAALPGAENLASKFNQFTLDELRKALEFAMPGAWGAMGRNITNDLTGVLSPDVSAAVGRSSVAKGFGMGLGGGASGIGRNLTLRDLGLTSYQSQQRGMTNFMGMSGILQKTQMDPSSMFFTPQQRLSHAVQERDDKFRRDLLAAQIQAAPDPGTKAIAEGIMADDAYWGGIFKSYMGGVMGGGGGTA